MILIIETAEITGKEFNYEVAEFSGFTLSTGFVLSLH